MPCASDLDLLFSSLCSLLVNWRSERLHHHQFKQIEVTPKFYDIALKSEEALFFMLTKYLRKTGQSNVRK